MTGDETSSTDDRENGGLTDGGTNDGRSGEGENDGLTDEAILREQICQLHDVIVSLENQDDSAASMHPEELWSLLQVKFSDNGPKSMHPRLIQMLHGYVDVNSVKRGLKRLENDLEDCGKAGAALYNPPKHVLSDDPSGVNPPADLFGDTADEDGSDRDSGGESSQTNFTTFEDRNEGD